ncbi:MAG: imidazolonepropionase [Melioribacteraceae bacterium]|nr:imidazolonepropionase [Melioribacteraceae bacterium]
MKTLLINASQIVTVNTNKKNYKRGAKELNNLDVISDHSILIDNGIISDFIPNSKLSKYSSTEKIDIKDKVVMPGLVECHTHLTFLGSRANEFKLKLRGASYEEIAISGGGILSTVQKVRGASHEELLNDSLPKINRFIEQGVTTLEIKSGYGLSYYDEIKLLQVINSLKSKSKIEIVPTFLGAHTYPPEYKNDHKKYLQILCTELIPFIAKNKLAEFCDVFCEETAFTSEDVERIFSSAAEQGLKLKLHTEQFHNVGGLDAALKFNATSIDHLEVIKESDFDKLADSQTAAVLLPGVSFFLDYDFAPARKLIDNNVIVALATDYNPGSSNISNISLVMGLAALKMKMTFEEIISSYTINSAVALNRSERIGSIEIGKNADFAIMNIQDYNDIIYNIGTNLNVMTIKKGNIVYSKQGE